MVNEDTGVKESSAIPVESAELKGLGHLFALSPKPSLGLFQGNKQRQTHVSRGQIKFYYSYF